MKQEYEVKTRLINSDYLSMAYYNNLLEEEYKGGWRVVGIFQCDNEINIIFERKIEK